MDERTERSSAGNSPLDSAMRAEAVEIATRRPDVVVTGPDSTGPQFYVDIWRSLAEHFVRNGFPGFGDRMPRSLIQDCGLQVAESLFRAANAVEFHMDAARELAFAEAHPRCEGDCGDAATCQVPA